MPSSPLGRARMGVGVAITCAVLACSRARPSGSEPQPASLTAEPGRQVRESAETKVQPDSALLTRARLREMGLSMREIDSQRALLCGKDEQCVCMEPLPCGSSCPSFADAVNQLQSTLQQPRQGRTVQCSLADSGSCALFSYFRYRGDLSRDETRWFDAAGKLTAIYSYSDHDAYCDGATRVLVQGDLPDCDATRRAEIYCGSGPVMTPPMEALLYDTLPLSERLR